MLSATLIGGVSASDPSFSESASSGYGYSNIHGNLHYAGQPITWDHIESGIYSTDHWSIGGEVIADGCSYNSTSNSDFWEDFENSRSNFHFPHQPTDNSQSVTNTLQQIDKEAAILQAQRLGDLALGLFGKGNYRDALIHFLSVIEVYEKFEPKSIRLAVYYYNVCNIYNNLKNTESALDYCQKSIDLRKEALGESHELTCITQKALIRLQEKLNEQDVVESNSDGLTL